MAVDLWDTLYSAILAFFALSFLLLLKIALKYLLSPR
jgi:hypothetical protein